MVKVNCNCFTDLNIIKEWGCFAMEIMGPRCFLAPAKRDLTARRYAAESRLCKSESKMRGVNSLDCNGNHVVIRSRKAGLPHSSFVTNHLEWK